MKHPFIRQESMNGHPWHLSFDTWARAHFIAVDRTPSQSDSHARTVAWSDQPYREGFERRRELSQTYGCQECGSFG